MHKTTQVELLPRLLLFKEIEVPDARILRRIPRACLRSFHREDCDKIDCAFVHEKRLDDLLAGECVVDSVHPVDIVKQLAACISEKNSAMSTVGNIPQLVGL